MAARKPKAQVQPEPSTETGLEIEQTKIEALTPDNFNLNRGTERGNYMLEQSLEKFGAGRSILIDKQGRIIAGNKTAEKFGELGLEDVVIVKTDGKKLVAVQRVDIDLDTPEGRELALADNRTSEINLDWDWDLMPELGIDLESWFSSEELFSQFNQGSNDNNSSNKSQDQKLPEQYQVLVICKSEAEQSEVLTMLSEQGHECKSLIV